MTPDPTLPERCKLETPGDVHASMPQDGRSPQLIHLDVDRRLGHEWDEWDGKPLPNGGDYSAPPRRFFWYAALSIAVLFGAAFFVGFLLVPRLEELW